MGRFCYENDTGVDRRMKTKQFKRMVLDAAQKLMEQGSQSLTVKRQCAYRGAGNKCCIVGFMLDDKTAEEADDLESSSVDDLVGVGLWGQDLTGYQLEVLMFLQDAHDSYRSTNSENFVDHFMNAVKTNNDTVWLYDALKNELKSPTKEQAE